MKKLCVIFLILLSSCISVSSASPKGPGCSMTTPAWVAPKNAQTFSNTHIQQFMATHGVTCVYQGSGIVTTTGYYQTRQSLANVQVDQPFTMSGTTISRVEVPVSIADQNGQDVTVGLYADSGGTPTGSAIAQTTIPREFISATVGQANFAEQNYMLDAPSVSTPSIAAPSPYDNYTGSGAATDGKNLVIIGGWNNVTYSAGVRVLNLASKTWLQAPDYPTGGLQELSVAINNGYVFGIGGLVGGSATSAIYSATISDGGQLGSWVLQTPLPTAVCDAAVTVVGNTLYVIGGDTSTATKSPTTNVYSATITNGAVGAWTTASFPYAITFAAAAVVNGYLVIIGGGTARGGPGEPVASALVSAAKINADGNTIQSWIPWPSLPEAIESGNALVSGNSILFLGGNKEGPYPTHNYTLQTSPTGPAPAWHQTIQVFTLQALGLGLVGSTIYNPQQGVSYSPLHGGSLITFSLIPNISVPLVASGLSNGTKYHIVIAGVSGSTQTGVQDSQTVIASTLTGGGAFTGNTKVGSGSWTALTSGYGVPLTVYSGNTGRLYHTMEDITAGVPADWNWYLWRYGGQLLALGEYQSQIRSFRTVTTSSGLPTLSS